MFFHHGSGENGNSIDRVKRHGPPKIVEQDPDFPFVVLSPQVPSNPNWEVINGAGSDGGGAWMALLDSVLATHAVDTDQVYLTGLSQGGSVSWDLGTKFPERFAAVVPIAGGLPGSRGPEFVCSLRVVPVWAFHGDSDTAVPSSSSSVLVDALEACNGNIRFTLYEGVGHVRSWENAYSDPALYDWLLQQSLTGRATSVQTLTWGAIKELLGSDILELHSP
jgi:predicted peptidase